MISVIIPVYNTEKYVAECIESVIVSCEKIKEKCEIILVDDGGSDDSARICDAFSCKYPIITTIHGQNGGVSSARNVGIRASTEDYIAFVDSDDYVSENYLLGLVEEIKIDTMVINDMESFDQRGTVEQNTFEPFFVTLESCNNAEIFRILALKWKLFSPCCRLFEKRIIVDHEIKFDETIRTAEDFDFNNKYIKFIKEIVYRPNVNYFYRIGYKEYKPSNAGVIGDSEIKSAHIMAEGIVNLAKRMQLFDATKSEIYKWIATKHYRNRLPMVFAINEKIGYFERRKLYYKLVNNPMYYSCASKGRKLIRLGKVQSLVAVFDNYTIWHIYYDLIRIKTGRKNK